MVLRKDLFFTKLISVIEAGIEDGDEGKVLLCLREKFQIIEFGVEIDNAMSFHFRILFLLSTANVFTLGFLLR